MRGSSFLFADAFILLAYVSLQVSIFEITEKTSRIPQLGLAMVAIQAMLFPLFSFMHKVEAFSWITLGIMLAALSLQTAVYLKRQIRQGLAGPMWLGIILLTGFALFNLYRSLVIWLHGVGPRQHNPFEAASVIVYLVTALGLGFAVFWMTSMVLRLELELLASTDPLTGLFNRRSFLVHCEDELLRSSRTSEPLSLVLLDLDHFKAINDIHGHDGGDAALCAVAGKLKAAVRDNDFLGRWGGEEFIVLLPGANVEPAMWIAERMRVSIEEMSLSHQPKGRTGPASVIRMTISAGLATGHHPVESLDGLLRNCDEALYCAKAAGRNRVMRWEPYPEKEAEVPPAVASHLRAEQLPAMG
jgi:diguanylate cyclase (GGDEF)-like protein